MGIKECPNGYKTINDEKTCEMASIALNLEYDASKNENNSNAICFYCSKWCRPLSTRVSSDYRKWARFICQKGMHLIISCAIGIQKSLIDTEKLLVFINSNS